MRIGDLSWTLLLTVTVVVFSRGTGLLLLGGALLLTLWLLPLGLPLALLGMALIAALGNPG
jgi:hypothetical protein